ncbi:hypothetical protein PVAG01_10612 [Phlyctema vagabunda]|uniref:Uncharacterized protein n=1 Tax=Phlyctema vagabunda TaxID=108571 RepID=A0ABR4P2R7_9HELO
MGSSFSSNQLAGARSSGVPTVSYAYSSGNTALFGVDATYTRSYQAYTGLITPYLVQPARPTVTCKPFSNVNPGVSSQSIKCPVTGASLAFGLNTISFSAFETTATPGTDGTYTTFFQSTLASFQGEVTFSVVPPQSTIPPTITVTATATATTTLFSGVSQIPATATNTVPSSVTTVTVYQNTIVSTQTSLSTLTGASYVTVTGSCTSTNTCQALVKPTNTLLQCNRDNCLRALVGKSATASSFCSQYTKTCGMPTPTYATACGGLTSRVSSACACLATASVAPAKRGAIGPVYAPPDFTYRAVIQQTVTVTGSPTVTLTSGPIPTSTATDPDSTLSEGTSTSTDNQLSTVTVTLFQSTVDGRVASTITVTPACTSVA